MAMGWALCRIGNSYPLARCNLERGDAMADIIQLARETGGRSMAACWSGLKVDSIIS
jgi:hypothetical protein